MKKTSKRGTPTTAPIEEETAPAVAVEEPAALAAAPPVRALPSSRQLVRSTVIAAAVAATLLLVAVLPAEYGIDPTGIGRLLGLTPMGEIKMALAEEARGRHRATAPAPVCVPAAEATTAPSAVGSASAASPGVGRRDEVRIVLAPNEGREIKLVMRKDARASYIWSADGGLTVDLHGEAADGRADSYTSYGKATGKRFDEGEIIAELDGIHGWFWRNRNHSEVSITLRTQGDYQDIKQSGTIAPTRPLDPPSGDHGHSH